MSTHEDTAARIAVVDDVAANVRLLQRIVDGAGLGPVATYCDPRQALAECLADPPDVLLLDLHMPDLDGFAFIAALQEGLPADAFVPVVVLTADATDEARDKALRAGAMDFLTKPFDSVEVVLRVRNMTQASRLYRTVNRHNAELRAELEAKVDAERAAAEQHALKLRQIEGVLASEAPEMVFQPILETVTGAVRGVEALARFACEPRRPPNEWFAQAVEVGLGNQLELKAVRAALDHLQVLPPSMFISVNVSPATVASPGLRDLLAVDPRRIVVELTEHVPIEDYPAVLDHLDGLRTQGVRIAVDDAGSGYAGLATLVRVAPDIIKLDRDLVSGITRDPCRRALASALVAFARDVGATLLAEGIETEAELDLLRGLGVAWGQGYHLGRPQPLTEPAPGSRVVPAARSRVLVPGGARF